MTMFMMMMIMIMIMIMMMIINGNNKTIIRMNDSLKFFSKKTVVNAGINYYHSND